MPSKPALAILLTCLVFGVLLAITGVRKDKAATDAQALRGGPNERDSRGALAGIVPETGVNPVQDLSAMGSGADEKGDESAASLVWPEQKVETRGRWGPDEEEAAQLIAEEQLVIPEVREGKQAVASLVWPEQQAETHGFWGPDTKEREQLAQLVTTGKWDRLMQEVDGSMSYSMEM